MLIIIQVLGSILLCCICGAVIYVFVLTIVSEKHAEKIFKIVPLYPRPKYAIILYSLSGILYLGNSYKYFGEFVATFGAMITIAPLCIIVSSLIVRAMAKSKNEDLVAIR